MCGIVGYAGFTNRVSLDKGISKINHRGPDDQGVAYFDKVALGSTRLAIIDLSKKGHQPMFNHDKSLCIVYNGEIYNFKDIKRLLEKKYQFKSHTDTETILYAYQEWGPKCLEKLNGMFSFVIYDLKKKIVFGARDRLGQKPLKYYLDENKLIFASEIKAVLALLGEKPEIDEVAIDNFLTFQYVPSPKTGFRNIYKLPAGHYFIYKNRKLSIQKYWSLKFDKKNNFADKEWEELIFNELNTAVKSHLISDVPVGALLSGGLDSSLMVALMSRHYRGKINTFSIGFDDQRFDESEYSNKVSKLYSTSHTKLIVSSKELMNNISKLVDFYDEPIADNSILPTLLVSKLASKKVKVALTGDGGDENFAGYDRYFIVGISEYLSKHPKEIKGIVQQVTMGIYKIYPHKQTERMKRFALGLDKLLAERYVDYNSFFTNEVKDDLYSKEFSEVIEKNNSFKFYKDLYNKKLSDLDNALNIDINTYLPDDLLYKTDIASMTYGLELRAPFLDHKLMEKIASMPSGKKIKFGKKKKILKEIAIKYKLLPQDLVNRPKQGFNIPQNKWFKGPLKKYLYETILDSKMVGWVFEKIKLKNYLDSYFNTNLNYDNNIFALLVLSQWINKYANATY